MSRLVNNAASYFDWMLKLCAFDNNSYEDPTLLESKIHGSYSLLECRNGFIMKLLQDVERALNTNKKDEKIALVEVERGLFAALVNTQLAMLSSSLACLKICSDPIPLMTCIRTCNNFLPRILQSKTLDLPLLLRYLHALLQNISLLIRIEKQNKGFDAQLSRGSTFTLQMIGLLESLSVKVFKLSRIYFLRFSKNLRGPASLGMHELLFSSYVAVLSANSIFGNDISSSLGREGITIDELTQMLSITATYISDYISKLGCVVIYSQTILALFAFVDLCSTWNWLSQSFPTVLSIREKSLRLLSSIASRYLLAQLLLDQNAQESTKINEPC